MYPFSDTEDVFRYNKETIPLYEKIKSTGDDRSYVIMSALIVEYLSDNLLELLLRHYEKLLKANNLTFSDKVGLFSSVGLIPKHIITCVSPIRRIRNEFSHTLELDSLDKISDKWKDALKSCVLKIPMYNQEEIPDESRKLFEKICGNFVLECLSS